MANKKISDLPAHTGNLAGTEEVEINNSGVSERTTVTKLSTAANTFINNLKGYVEFDIEASHLSVGATVLTYSTAPNSLIGLVSLPLVMVGNGRLKHADFTYDSALGKITLLGGLTFKEGSNFYAQYKKA